LALENPRLFYDLLFTTTAKTLLAIASDPKHLGAQIGVIAILHTWGQNLLLHPHIHCVIPAGAISPDHRRWVRPRYPFFLPVKVLSRVFPGRFLAGLKRLHRSKKLQCAGPAATLADPRQFAKLLRRLHRHDWVVYAKPAFGGPMQMFRYLGRYTHRVAISNHTLVGLRSRTRHFPLEGLCPRRQAGPDDTDSDRVLAPLFSARAAQRLRPHPSLWLFGESLSGFPSGVEPTTTGFEQRNREASWNPRRALRGCLSVALPTLWRIDDRDSEIDS
jgi:putative transposase